MRKPVGTKVLYFPPGLWWRVPGWWGEACGPQVAAVGWAAAMWESRQCGACRFPTLRNKWDLSDARGLCTVAPLTGFFSLLPTLSASHFQTSSPPRRT